MNVSAILHQMLADLATSVTMVVPHLFLGEHSSIAACIMPPIIDLSDAVKCVANVMRQTTAFIGNVTDEVWISFVGVVDVGGIRMSNPCDLSNAAIIRGCQ